MFIASFLSYSGLVWLTNCCFPKYSMEKHILDKGHWKFHHTPVLNQGYLNLQVWDSEQPKHNDQGSRLFGWPKQFQVFKCSSIFRYKSSSMLIHLFIGWALVYGWMTRLILLHEGILRHLCKKSPKKHVFGDFLLENSFFKRETQNLLQMCSRGCFWS